MANVRQRTTFRANSRQAGTACKRSLGESFVFVGIQNVGGDRMNYGAAYMHFICLCESSRGRAINLEANLLVSVRPVQYKL